MADTGVLDAPDDALRRAAPGRSPLLWLAVLNLAALVLAVVTEGWRPLGWLYRVSWHLRDPTYMPKGQHDRALLGGHYFGDWQLYLGWARDPHPYVGHDLNFNGLPAGLWLLRPFTWLPLGVSYAVAVALGLGLTGWAVARLTPGMAPWSRLGVWLLTFGLSSGVIVCLDRGNLVVIVFGLIGLWIAALRDGRPVVAGLLLAVAVCVKPYLALLLLWPLASRAWRAIAWTVVPVAVTTLIGFALQPGPFWTAVAGYREATAIYTTHNISSSVLFMNTPSLLGLLIHPVTISGGIVRGTSAMLLIPTWLLILPGLLWAVLVAYVTLARRLSGPVTLCLVLSLSQLLLPSAQAYTMAWAGLGAVIMLTAEPDPGERVLRRLVWAALAVTLVPLTLTYGGDAPWSHFLSPLAWLAAGAVALAMTARRPSTMAASAGYPAAARTEGS